jgi:rhodanese-related sulfurtransferase
MTKEEFVKEVTDGILPPPQYFAKNVMLNKTGADSLDDVMATGNIALDVDTFEAMANHEGALVLDTRNETNFVQGFVPNSIFIGVDGSFAPWVGALIADLQQPIILVADEGREEEVITRLSRVGYDNTLGYLKGGIAAWKAAGKEIDTVTSVGTDVLKGKLETETINVLDVRKPGEYLAEHIEKAKNTPLDFINTEMNRIDKNTEYYIHCAGGYRSVIFSSILKSRGFDKVINVAGGFDAIVKEGIPVTDFVCPSTLN